MVCRLPGEGRSSPGKQVVMEGVTVMNSICLWCKKEMELPVHDGSEPIISEGICADCSNNMIFQMGVDLQQFLDSLQAPVILISGEGILLAGNEHACALIGNEFPDSGQRLLGEAFECEYSRLPGGCGKTVHCSGCTIRRCFTETYTTGKSLRKVKAFLKKDSQKINLFISTEKIGQLQSFES